MIFIDGVHMLGLRDVDVREVTGIAIYASNTDARRNFRIRWRAPPGVGAS